MSARVPRGHVARAIANGKRPFLTCTVAAETFATIDRLAAAANVSRGRLIDSWAATAAAASRAPEAATVDAPALPRCPACTLPETSGRDIHGARLCDACWQRRLAEPRKVAPRAPEASPATVDASAVESAP